VEFLFEILLQVAFEIVLNIFGYFVAALIEVFIVHILRLDDKSHPLLDIVVLGVLASLFAAISLHLYPSLFIKNEDLRIANIVFVPAFICLLVFWANDGNKLKPLSMIQTTAFGGAFFALVFAGIRFFFAS
jgi:RsiW-degrading membrane proteinase PrsW (M82 family)